MEISTNKQDWENRYKQAELMYKNHGAEVVMWEIIMKTCKIELDKFIELEKAAQEKPENDHDTVV